MRRARCYAAPDRPLKVVAVEPLTGGRKPQAFFSTCPADTIEQVLTRYAARWSLEVTNHDAKGQLGFEEPQGWTKQAVQRTAPTAMLLYSLVGSGSVAKGIATTSRPRGRSPTCWRRCGARAPDTRFYRWAFTAGVAERSSTQCFTR